MRLVDLDPSWFVLEEGGPVVGLSFECPHCRKQRLGILFHHSGREAMEDAYLVPRMGQYQHIWTMQGDGFENLTLTPSVDASAEGHWHGFVTNGAIA